MSTAARPTAPLRVALFTHSTNPRGGVAHAIAVGEALHALGHHAVVHAADASGRGFPRAARCPLVPFPVAPARGGLAALVRQRVDDYARFVDRSRERYDVYHAGDPISACALATLTERGRIPGYLRTVHHLDSFADPYLAAQQARSVRAADRCLCVSEHWRRVIALTYGVHAAVVPNGVDATRFTAVPAARDAALRARFAPAGDAPLFLAVGGVEPRKNTIAIVQAFARVAGPMPRARLVIAGGATLLDHGGYRAAFDAALDAALDSSGARVRERVCLAGIVADDDMPSLFRVADALLFPSLSEGFGLVVLEAMASGTPVVCPTGPPFDEYLRPGDALRVDPGSVTAIAAAMHRAVAPAVRARLRARGLAASRRLTWAAAAEHHLAHYHDHLSRRKARPDAGDDLSSALAG